MFGKTKPARPKRERTDNSLAQYGLFDVSSFENGTENDDDGDDSELEAELLSLSKGGASKPKRPPKKVAPAVDLDAMVANSMRDIPSDEELSGDDDPDILNELGEYAGDSIGDELEQEPQLESLPSSPKQSSTTNSVQLLEDRIKMYQLAEQNAKDAGETSRARRFNRGITTLKDLLKQAKAGKPINNDDIPPEVTVNVQKRPPTGETETCTAIPSRPAPNIPSPEGDTPPTVSPQSEIPPTASPEEEPTPASFRPKTSPEKVELSSENVELIELLNARKNEYKVAALEAKKSNDTATALNYIKIAKQFEAVIKAVESGQPVDLSNMPGSPSPIRSTSQESTVPEVPVVQNEIQTESPEQPLPEPELIKASSIAEALQQRLEVYQNQEAKAKEEGNSSKVRRMGRIVKQFEEAIKFHKAGKPVAFEDLPTPPGYAPIPVEGGSVPKAPEPNPKPAVKPSLPPAQPQPSKSNAAQSRIDKQVVLLTARQKEFKDAALKAKQKGELTQAKEFLRSAKGFDPLIEAARGGLPVDIATLPVPPSAKSQLEEEYEVVMGEEVSEIDPEQLDILTRLEQQLTKQMKLCLTTRDHNKAIGDVAGMNRFEQLALSVTRDLDLIRLAKKSHNISLPKFHYETKDFSIVKSCTDLTDNDLELTIVRGLNYTCSNPNEIDTYVKFEFPFPQDTPVTNKTVVVKDTNNPEYNATFVLPIQRTSRPCQRVFKRHGVKLEVYSKGCSAIEWACCFSGFFRGDTLIGTTLVKLQPLETQCEYHESFDLVEGRKKVGGKIEVRLRVRDPILTRQVEQLSEKWLVLDH